MSSFFVLLRTASDVSVTKKNHKTWSLLSLFMTMLAWLALKLLQRGFKEEDLGLLYYM